ncbi:MAG: (2Fe-2S) ferredoxin domain-containing protein [Candidatus Marinimicrobia bacterium]|nr:(2Fe-2S) ferredoxin domain-containing protein [Candidatus Neomarinimicrobiota bacterium]
MEKQTDKKSKTIIALCMGSSCFARKNTTLVTLINEFLLENNLVDSVELIGNLCMDKCKEGPNIKIDNQIFHQIDAVKLIKILSEKLL